jgi:haloalkane dehalogenase
MSRVDEGGGRPVVMLHGNPSWSYLYRHMVAGLGSRCRCIAPDHLGCGYSDKPRNYPYRLRNHIDNLENLLEHLEVEKCSLVMHDWGGAIGMGWAVRHPERVERLVIMNTAAFPGPLPLRIRVCGWPFLGPLLVRGLNGFARAAVHMAAARRLAPEVAAGFLAPYGSWGDRAAILGFIRDIPLNRDHPSWDELMAIEQGITMFADKPVLVCWGGKDFCFTRYFFEEWRRRLPDAEYHFFADAGHYLLEDAFARIFPVVRRFLLDEGKK